MSIPAATKNAMLDALSITHASLHSAYPGAIGSSEISGSPYARKAVVINPGSGGQRTLNAAVTFDVPASTVRWVGFWSGSTFVDCAPNGGATPRNFVSLSSNSTFYSPSHGYADGQKVVVYRGTPPGGITAGAVYYVRDAATDSFKVAATLGGTAITLTSAPSYQTVVCAITESVYPATGTHELASATFAIAD